MNKIRSIARKKRGRRSNQFVIVLKMGATTFIQTKSTHAIKRRSNKHLLSTTNTHTHQTIDGVCKCKCVSTVYIYSVDELFFSSHIYSLLTLFVLVSVSTFVCCAIFFAVVSKIIFVVAAKHDNIQAKYT